MKSKKSKCTWTFIIGLIVGLMLFALLYQTSEHYSSDKSCLSCHVHDHVEASWKQSLHVMNQSGVTTHCVACHLPPRSQTLNYYSSKLKLGLQDLWGYMVKDSADFDWNQKSELDYAVKYIPNASCKECHTNLFPQGVSEEAAIAHLYYEDNEKKLNLQCISCHLNAGHYDPNYTHGTTTAPLASSLIGPDKFEEATPFNGFQNFEEHVPGTSLRINMVAIPGGKFHMGSPKNEPFHQPDEEPVREVTVDNFYMSEVEVTWDAYWTFFMLTSSEGRTPPEKIYANNNRPDVDAVSGPTPPFGAPDQGWGGGTRPAITMTHYGAETFCQWLSLQTGKHYRLPTEAEWEYAARGGTETPYFFEGNPRSFSSQGFMRDFLKPKTEVISKFVVYALNSQSRTNVPESVKPNPFGLKNMLGNVMEYTADKYSPNAYAKTSTEVTNPICTEGNEWVVRGGHYQSDASEVRCAARAHTEHDKWLRTDPQQPKSIWWYSDIKAIGFRVVCDAE